MISWMATVVLFAMGSLAHAERPEAISRLCTVAEARAQQEFKQTQLHPEVRKAEQDIQLQIAYLKSVFSRIATKDWIDIRNNLAEFARSTNSDERALIDARSSALRDRIVQLTQERSLFISGSEFEIQKCAKEGSVPFAASQVSGLGDWRDTVRQFYPDFVRTCPTEGNGHRHTLPLLLRSVTVEWKSGESFIIRARTFRQLGRQDGKTMVMLESRLDLGKRTFEGLHFGDSLVATTSEPLLAAAHTASSYRDLYLRKNGVYDVCRDDEAFLNLSKPVVDDEAAVEPEVTEPIERIQHGIH